MCVLLPSVCTTLVSKSTFLYLLSLSSSAALASHSFTSNSSLLLSHHSVFSDANLFHFSCFFLFSLFFNCSLPFCSSFFCPSRVGDSRQCWEAYGLLIKKQGGTRPQLTRTHTDICNALLVRIGITYRGQC